MHTHPWRCASLQTSNISGAAAAAANAQIEFLLFHLKQTLAVSITEPANQRLVRGLVPCIYIHYKNVLNIEKMSSCCLANKVFECRVRKKGSVEWDRQGRMAAIICVWLKAQLPLQAGTPIRLSTHTHSISNLTHLLQATNHRHFSSLCVLFSHILAHNFCGHSSLHMKGK